MPEQLGTHEHWPVLVMHVLLDGHVPHEIGVPHPLSAVPQARPLQLLLFGVQQLLLLRHTPVPQPPQLTCVPQLLFMVPQRPVVQGETGTQTHVPLEHAFPWFAQFVQLVVPQESLVLSQTHELLEQCFPEPQAFPQPPQLLLLLVVSTHVPLQPVCPPGQQMPLEQLMLTHCALLVQLPLFCFALQVRVALSQKALVPQFWLAAKHTPLPLHVEAFTVVRSGEQAFAAPQPWSVPG